MPGARHGADEGLASVPLPLPVGYSLALFQLSTLISVFLGCRYFQEGQIRKRLLGSVIMAAGAMLIVLLGHRR
jgi:drug/metabolite transporter (DMT)-like permease